MISQPPEKTGPERRVLMFAPECYPVSTAESIVASKLVLAMLDAGWHVDVVCRRDIVKAYPDCDKGLFEAVGRVCTAIDCTRHEVVNRLCASGKGAGLLWSALAVTAGLRCIKRVRPDFIFSRIMPQYGHVPALILSKCTGIPWVANWSDPMPYRVAPKPFGGGPEAEIGPALKRYCLAVVAQARWHTFPSVRLRDYMCGIFPALSRKACVIPHIAYSKLGEAPRSSRGSFTICSAGGFGWRNPFTFLQAVRMSLAKDTNRIPLTLKLVGPIEANVQQMVVELGLDSIVKWLGPLPYARALHEMATSSIGVIIEADSPDPIFLPSKAMDFMQAGIPVLAVTPPGSELSRVFGRYGGGLSVDCTSPPAILAGLRTLHSLWQSGNLQSHCRMAQIRDEFSEHQILQTYGRLLKDLSR
jgi:glycosyltransferase involved in cell wall biosynthesis